MRPLRIIVFILAGITLISISSLAIAQEADVPKEYMGSGECGDCHRGLARDHDVSPHVKAFQDATSEEVVILGDFAQESPNRMVTFPEEAEPRPFTAEDIAYVMGAGRYLQAYVYQGDEGDLRVFPAEWDVANQQWIALGDGADWLTNPAYDWVERCAGCHVTGLTQTDEGKAEWVDDGVQCEACHGAGSIHVEAADTLSRRASDEELQALREKIVFTPDAEMCGQCHSQGLSTDGIHPYPVGHDPSTDLASSFNLVADDAEGYWWTRFHAQKNNMQYNEWLKSAHSTALTTLQGSSMAEDACLQCHSADYRFTQGVQALFEEGEMEGSPPELPTLDNAQYGITCTTCHNPHLPEAEFFLRDEPYQLCVSCHTSTEVTPTLHHPVQQMFEGASMISAIEGMPAVHFAEEEGPDCLSCHMARLPAEGGFTLASHALKPFIPEGETASTVASVCASCHTDLTVTDVQYLIDNTQESIRGRLVLARTRLTSLTPPLAEETARQTQYNEVVTALDFVQNDGSLGIHNYAYADALLDFAERSLSELSVRNANSDPTEAPAPTATPDPSAVTVMVQKEISQESLRPTTVLVWLITVGILIVGAGLIFRKRGSNV